MIHYHVYPGGKRRIVTFSYDDGPVEDIRLIEMFNKYGVKGTFHLNGIRFANCTEEEKEALRRRYAGHEVSCHTLQHGWLPKMPLPLLPASQATQQRMASTTTTITTGTVTMTTSTTMSWASWSSQS